MANLVKYGLRKTLTLTKEFDRALETELGALENWKMSEVSYR